MRFCVLSIVVLSMLVPTAVWCEELEEIAEQEAIERQMELRGREMELEHREAEMGHEREMRELELQERRSHIEREMHEPEHAWHHKRHDKEDVHPLLLLCLVVHILVAVWVYMDIRKLNRGSGIWIVIALLTGLLGTLVYAIVRLGDGRKEKS
ncbi:MAG: hypothetical protein U9Q07_02500 [Planctomycetota bacterium]|nr:hypothetical protein [Planctomycetota bacterium]